VRPIHPRAQIAGQETVFCAQGKNDNRRVSALCGKTEKHRKQIEKVHSLLSVVAEAGG
jgi:hypothetical protein